MILHLQFAFRPNALQCFIPPPRLYQLQPCTVEKCILGFCFVFRSQKIIFSKQVIFSSSSRAYMPCFYNALQCGIHMQDCATPRIFLVTSIFIQGVPKKCPIATFSLNLFQRSIILFAKLSLQLPLAE